MKRDPDMRVTAAALVFALCVAAPMAAPAASPPHVVGQWATLPYLMTINPIHVALLHTGKVLVLAGTESDPTVLTRRMAVWSPQHGVVDVQSIPWDFYCNGFAFLADGRLLVAGGNLQYSPNTGLTTTSIFDPVTESFTQVQDMAHGRWYPTSVALGDGRITTFSGLRETTYYAVNDTLEIYDVASGWSPEYRAPFTPTYYYPWMHLLPNGKLFISGHSPSAHFFDPGTRTWEPNVAFTNFAQDRITGTSVLLPLWPDLDYRPRVMILGGKHAATATAEIIDLSESPLAWKWLPSMSSPRSNMNAVILPTGKVLALGGAAEDGVAGTASLQADLFDPQAGTWSPAGTATYPRMYHSVALLLPDATVWTAGSNPLAGTYEKHMEIYSPAYLFTTDGAGQTVPAPRPTITAAPGRVGYGATFTVRSPEAAEIASAVLIRPGASTHAFDMEQRLVGLTFSQGPADTLVVTAPPDGNIAPPGYYMLFLLNRQGVPSVARFVQLTPTPSNQPPAGAILSPATDVTIAVGESVPFEGTGVDPDGTVVGYSWAFPTGTPAGSPVATPGPVTFSTPGEFVVTFTVTDNVGESDPSPPSRVITVTPSSNQPPQGEIVSPAADITITAGESVAFEGIGVDVDGTVVGYAWTFSGGTPATSSGATAGLVTFSTPGQFAATLTVTDNVGENDPHPPSRVITVERAPGGGLTSPGSGRPLAPGTGVPRSGRLGGDQTPRTSRP